MTDPTYEQLVEEIEFAETDVRHYREHGTEDEASSAQHQLDLARQALQDHRNATNKKEN